MRTISATTIQCRETGTVRTIADVPINILLRKLFDIDVGSYHAITFMSPLLNLVGSDLEVNAGVLVTSICTK